MRTRSSSIVVIVGCWMLVSGCDFFSSSPTTSASPTPGPSASRTPSTTASPGVPALTLATEVGHTTTLAVDKKGGLLKSAGGGAIVIVPPGILADTNNLSIAAQDANNFGNPNQLLSHVYDIGPSGLDFGASINITLSLVGAVPTGTRPVLAYLNAQNTWQVVPKSTYNPVYKNVQAVVTHFTNFAILAIPANGAGCAQSPDPNAYCSPSSCNMNSNICGGTTTTLPWHQVGGQIQGLGTSATLILSINKTKTLMVHANGNFVMPSILSSGAAYTVAVALQPNNTVCSVTEGTGVVGATDVNTVMVNCVPTVALTGTVTGLDLAAQITLQNGNFQVSAHGIPAKFSLPRVVTGANFNVTVAKQPADQNCTVTNGSGIAPQTDIVLSVVCEDLSWHVQGRVSGLLGNTYVTILDSNSNTRVSNGNYALADLVHVGNPYSVQLIPPSGQACVFDANASGSGIMGSTPAILNVVCSPVKYRVGGAIVGLTANANVIINNGNDAINSSNGNYLLGQGVAYASIANLTITNPAGQTCLFNTGKNAYAFNMGAADMTSVDVHCTTNSYSIGGMVSGLVAQAQVTLINGNDISAHSNGKFVLPQLLHYATDYNVVVVAPTGQNCAFINGQTSAVGTMGTANVTDLNIICAPMTFALGGRVTGLVANANILIKQGNTNVSVSNGDYRFPQPVAYNIRYFATLVSPPSQDCGFTPTSNNVGTMGLGDVTNVNVTCTPQAYSLGGMVSGLVGISTVTLHNGNDTLAARNGSYHFPSPVPYDSNYAVSLTPPANHNCVFLPGNSNSGVMVGANLADVNVVCTPASFTMGGSVAGLLANTHVAITHGNDTIAVSNGNYTFPTSVKYGTPYAITLVNPVGQSCIFSPASIGYGSMPAAPLNANVVCSQLKYTLGGAVSGLAGTVQLRNGNDTLRVVSNGNFKMAAGVPYQSSYNVAVMTQPTNQNCTVTQGSGVMQASNVSNVVVTCDPTHTVGGHVVNLLAGGNIVVGNGNDAVTVAATNPNWTFPTLLASSVGYNTVVLRQPVGQACTVNAGSGTMAQQNITSIVVQCAMALKFTTNQNAVRVIGQTSFAGTSTAIDNTHLSGPVGSLYAAANGNIFIGDMLHYRIVGYFTGLATTSGRAFDFVVGQKNFTVDANWAVPNANNYAPNTLVGNQNILVQTDGYDNRVLILHGLPKATVNANVVLGQNTFVGHASACTQSGMNVPRGASLTPNNTLFVADSLNNRVLVWLTLPNTNGQAADLVLGQPDFVTCTQPANNASSASTLSQPYDVWSDGTHVMVADTYASRVLVWNSPPMVNGQGADAVIGQAGFAANTPAAAASGVGMPAGVVSDGNSIFVAEHSYARATQWSGLPWSGATPTLTTALGEPDLTTTECNQGGTTPSAHGLCQPAGITIVGTQLVVTDYGNNRLMVFQSQ